MKTTNNAHHDRLIALYLALPHTPAHASRYDYRLALELCQRISWEVLETALLLAMARRCLRDSSLAPLQPIRSLHYFLPVIDEVLNMEISTNYVQYLKRKLAPYVAPATF